MKQKLFILFSLPLVLLATGCGKGGDDAVNTNAVAAAPAAATPTCPQGQVYGAQGCASTQYGTPPGYNGGGSYPGYPVGCPYANNNTNNNGGNNGYPGNGYPGGYPNGGGYNNGGYNACGNTSGYYYRWYYYNGLYYFF